MAGPVAAQQPKVVTAPGVNGQPACPGGITATHLDDSGIAHLVIPNGAGNIAIQANPFGFTTYSSLRGRIGDGSTTSFPMRIRVTNTRTGSQAHDVAAGTIDSTNTTTGMTVNLAVDSTTPYSVIYYANVSSLGPTRQESTSCFMTGGTYTINNAGSSNFIDQISTWGNRMTGPGGTQNVPAACTEEGQLGTDSQIQTRATAVLNNAFNTSAPGNGQTEYNAARQAAINAGADANHILTWQQMVTAEVAAIKRTFDPGLCRAPEADQPQSNGCYSISPRTPLDVYNCLCGRSPRPTGFDAGEPTDGCDGS